MRKIILTLVLAGLLPALAGCNVNNFVGTCRVSTAAIGVKTLAVEFGAIDGPGAIANVATVKALELCIDGWHKSIVDDNVVSPEQIACAITLMNKLDKESAKLRPAVEKEIQAEYGLLVRISAPAAPDDIENAYKIFKDTCAGYYWVVEAIYGTGNTTNSGHKHKILRDIK